MAIRKRYQSKKTKAFSSIISVAVVLMLIFSGPVRAITLGVDIKDDKVTEQQEVEITAKVDLHSRDIVPEDLNFTITIKDEHNKEEYSCVFDINGDGLEGCQDFEITPMSQNFIYHDTKTALYGYGYGYDGSGYTTIGTSLGYGYGYGYKTGYGYDTYSTSLTDSAEIVFKITWTTPEVDEETTYSVSLEAKAKIGEGFTYATLLENQGSFTVSPEEDSGGSGHTPVKPREETEYEKRLDELTEGLLLHIKKNVINVCDQMKGVIEGAKESKVFTDTSEFNEQINKLGLDNVEAVMTNLIEEEVTPKELSEEVREQVKEKIGEKELKEVSNIKRNVNVITFITEDGTSSSIIEISYDVELGDYVVEVPKSVAETADEIEGNFEVLVNDPVLMFSNTDNVEFAVESKTNEVEEKLNESIALSKLEEIEEDEIEPEPVLPEEEEEEDEDEPEPVEPTPPAEEEEKSSLAWLWISLVLLAVIVVISIIAYRRSKKE
ncbi:MAG: hypothetical protein PWQ87_172 [Candidatus Woesearchaeota archaeon]|nr:hypothetical protein [Candidatus Woesearchaeota archaeon]